MKIVNLPLKIMCIETTAPLLQLQHSPPFPPSDPLYDAAPSKVVCEPLFGKPTSNLPFLLLLVRVKGMVSHVLRQGVDSI